MPTPSTSDAPVPVEPAPAGAGAPPSRSIGDPVCARCAVPVEIVDGGWRHTRATREAHEVRVVAGREQLRRWSR